MRPLTLPLQDHPEFSLEAKEQILADWLVFIRSGFDFDTYSSRLHSYFFERILRDAENPYIQNRYLKYGDRLFDLAIREVFWRDHFHGEFIDLYITMYNLSRLLDYPDQVEHRLKRYAAGGDLDIAVSQMMVHFMPRIVESWQEREAEYIDRTVQAQIDAAMEADPTLTLEDFEDCSFFFSIPDEQRQITAAVRARFAQAVAPQRRPITQPALFQVLLRRRRITSAYNPEPAPNNKRVSVHRARSRLDQAHRKPQSKAGMKRHDSQE